MSGPPLRKHLAATRGEMIVPLGRFVADRDSRLVEQHAARLSRALAVHGGVVLPEAALRAWLRTIPVK